MKKKKKQQKTGMGKCVATAILYPLIAVIIAFVKFNSGEVVETAFYASMACSALAALITLISGLYFIILPLPYVSLYWYGAAKERSGLSVLIYVLLILGLLALSMFFVFGDVSMFF